ncbi:hypothetical protein BC939DRAFT_435677 [Gamsiella multidivaricata]|uniref:uncharacterized protein n=1 Tax=Gamsiella multidivaricata TaxID=101098 RepID=UPI00221FC731|nr:uncharacterized protein BC939DRAFT_435677 [Gamsiella multidivaricata]KAI7832505.1 hypothetical protein BC939DRAFT_435677 [Gamsiella multidivaricata]
MKEDEHGWFLERGTAPNNLLIRVPAIHNGQELVLGISPLLVFPPFAGINNADTGRRNEWIFERLAN